MVHAFLYLLSFFLYKNPLKFYFFSNTCRYWICKFVPVLFPVIFSETHAPKTTVSDTASIKAPPGQGCPRCGGAVFAAELMLSKGREWHRKCFKCKDCTKTLDSINACDGPDKDIYCNTCYGKKWGPHGYGFACGSGFLQTDGVRLFLCLFDLFVCIFLLCEFFFIIARKMLVQVVHVFQATQHLLKRQKVKVVHVVEEQYLLLNNNSPKDQSGIRNASVVMSVIVH
jgi:LIM domain